MGMSNRALFMIFLHLKVLFMTDFCVKARKSVMKAI